MKIDTNVRLDQYTTLHVGGVADYFVVVRTAEELRDAWQRASLAATRPFVLGGGSNVLIADEALKRFVIKIELKGITYEAINESTTRVTAAAGESWDDLVAATVEKGLRGLENLSGIPGTVGAAPVQNINAYGATIAEVIESVTVYDGEHDGVRILPKAECQFGYRDSLFKRHEGTQLTVIAVTFILTKNSTTNVTYRSSSQSIERYLTEHSIVNPTSSEVRAAVLHVRGTIGMLLGQFRSAGSFFKNTIVSREAFAAIEEIVTRDFADLGAAMTPWHWHLASGEEKIATAFLLECSPYNKSTYGVKRFNGVVGLSPLHSLSIVTEEGATAHDVTAFVAEIIQAVKNIFDVTLETEVDYIQSL